MKTRVRPEYWAHARCLPARGASSRSPVSGSRSRRMTIVAYGTTVDAVTITDVTPTTEETNAATELVNVAAVEPAVKSPVLASIVPPPAPIIAHDGVIAMTLPCVSVPTAVNCCVAPSTTLGLLGEMVTFVSAPGKTVIDARPEVEPHPDPCRATTVFVNVPATVPAVKTPLLSIEPPPETTNHVGVIGTTLS
jgi:hypothetical protein